MFALNIDNMYLQITLEEVTKYNIKYDFNLTDNIVVATTFPSLKLVVAFQEALQHLTDDEIMIIKL